MDELTRKLESLDRGPGTVWRQELEGGIIQEGTSRAGTPHGPFRQWFSNGQLRLDRYYRNGELHGVCRQYTPDGKMVAEFTMTNGNGVFLEYWDTGKLKLRWKRFQLAGMPCRIMECFDIDGGHPLRSYTWKGAPCRTKKRFLDELRNCGLTLPAADKIDDPDVWANFVQQAGNWVPPTSRQS